MHSDQTDIRPDPTVVLVDELLDDIGHGRLRVPVFQRPFVWKPEQMLTLFDSIERGYPIGSLLVWQTEDPVPSLSQIGGVEIPEARPGRPVSYILDGHQRLSTLFGILRRRSHTPTPEGALDFRWHVYRDLRERGGADRYRHHRGAGPAPEYLLPLGAVMRTMDFLRFSRELELRMRDTQRLEEMIREAEAVAQRIKSYKLTLVRLQGASLHQAVEVYTRLNRTGTRMDADQMISALTHRTHQPSLASRIDDIVSSVAGSGFGELPRLAVFRAVLAIAGEPDIMSPRWEAVAERMQNKLHDALPATERAVNRAAQFLQTGVGLPLARFLPYSHQLVLLAAFFHHCPEPERWQYDRLRRWFWVTSWSNAFAGATSTMLRQALGEMRAFADGEADLDPDTTDVQPMPDSFNLNSARTKAYVIWEHLELPRRLDALGQPFDVVKVLASAESQAYRKVVYGDSRPANRLILPTVPGQGLWTALENLPVSNLGLFGDASDEQGPAGARQIIESHGIPVSAWFRLKDGNGDLFVEDRTKYLEGRLRIFADRMSIPVGGDLAGVADDDAE
ncbi:DUF262 domain-containing protein [Micromonospora tulbaghiae]|uniref:DUF262 domain-containing protein n=1 Tax=Micromonospora tulbaghiae TaxID=479978 RepID=A0AAW4JIV2_9ACTN|nr:DUF262 domain-containing protein [Micromonospora tulbaghiae]MBO4141923.1 DUF262 domain-containing protein [Micromonospora tulbaghiae]